MDEEDASGTDAKGLTRNSLSERIYARLRVALMTGVYEFGRQAQYPRACGAISNFTDSGS